MSSQNAMARSAPLLHEPSVPPPADASVVGKIRYQIATVRINPSGTTMNPR
jgi:hypothetical protein